MTTTTAAPTCRWAGDHHPRLTRTHQPDCDTATCNGCQPCPERHCRVCGHTHVTVDARGTDQTCANCIGDTRAAIARIVDLTAVMTVAATERGVNSLAALHAGPTGNIEAHRHVHRSMATGRLCRCRTARGRQCPATLPPAYGPTCAPDHDQKPCKHGSCDRIRGQLCPDVIAWHEDVRDELHPLWVLGTWDFAIRDHYGHLVPLVPLDDGDSTEVAERTLTLNDAATYISQHLSHLAHDPDFDYDQFHTETTRCRTHLEEVLAVAPYTETGAPCPACGRGQLEKSYGTTQDDDRWTCPKCRQWWTEHDYRAKVSGVYVTVAPALTASQIRETYRVPEGSTRGWATKGLVTKHGRDTSGRMLYDVADVLTCRDRTAS